MIEVTFVGTGSALPPIGHGTTVFTVQTEDILFLADAGPTAFDGLQRAGIEPAEIDAIFLSHGHADHVLGFPQLVLQAKLEPKDPPLKVFCTAQVREIVHTIVKLTFPEAYDTLGAFQWIELAEGPRQTNDLTDNIQLATQIVFGPPYMPVLGLRLDFLDKGIALAFSADTAPSDELASLATGSGLLIHESSSSELFQTDVSS